MSRRHSATVVAVLWLAVGLLLSASASLAQTVTATSGAVNGVVTDSSAAVVPGVAVTLSGSSLIAARLGQTDGDGAYRFSGVPPGEVTLTFELPGFGTVVQRDIRVGVGFTATIDVVLRPGEVTQAVTVSGATPVVDRSSTAAATHFDARTLASLPGSRDVFALLASTPGVALSRIDVGGNGALSLQDYTAYGLRATTGVNRNEVEGIRVGGANGANDNYLSDFSSFEEIAVKAVGQGAATAVPGTLVQYVSKAGGDTYRGSVYADFQNDAMEAHNIDAAQIASGVSGGPGLDARDVNRLERFRDFTADVGGFLKKNKAWWYGAYRSSAIAQRYPWLLDTAATLSADVVTGKVTYLLSSRQKLVGYLQRESFTQSSYFGSAIGQPLQTSASLPGIVFPVSVWKAEYTNAIRDAVYVEGRVGGYHSDAKTTFKTSDPRIVDIGANIVTGGAFAQERLIDRPQANGSASVTRGGRGGSHTIRIGGEFMSDRVVTTHDGFGHPCNCVSTLNNGVPTQVLVQLGSNVSRNDLTTIAGYVDDTWRVASRVTLSMGLRVDRYQPSLPAQEGVAGQTFAASGAVLTFTNWGPRLGLTTDLTGDGKTVLKAHYGTFWVYPSPLFTASLNPNPPGWSRTYAWPADVNGNGRWDPGEEGSLVSVTGGSTSTRLDPGIANTYVRQASVYVERELAPNVGLRTGVVVNAKRQPYGNINVNRPLAAYAVPLTIADPGPDGRLGSPDDGAPLTVQGLSADALAAAPVNLTTNLPGADSEYYTWELTATRRRHAHWSMLASVAHTWSREAALGPGNEFTPNVLVNTVATQDRFTTWQAKVQATLNLGRGVTLVPVLRHQSGQPFARSFVQRLNYGNATIKAEPVGTRRMPDITLLDVRAEKSVQFWNLRVIGFFDLYNILNTNAAQVLTTSSGASWLRPTVITAPRVLRLGARLDW